MGAKVRSALLTNPVTWPDGIDWNQKSQATNVTSNSSIPIRQKNDWQLGAIRKVLKLKYELSRPNWDTYGSAPLDSRIADAAMSLLEMVPFENLPSPRIVPVSGGGIQIELSKGCRELELYLRPSETIEVLRIQDGVPLNDGEILPSETIDIETLFTWLNTA